MTSPYRVNKYSILHSVSFKRYFDCAFVAAALPPHAGWWVLKFLSKIISPFILSKANFIDLSIIMTFLLFMGLYMLITVTLTPFRRIVTAAIYASYSLYAQFPGANNLLIMKYTLVVLFASYRSEYSLG